MAKYDGLLGQPILEVHCNNKNIAAAKIALTRARHKFPKGGYLLVEDQ